MTTRFNGFGDVETVEVEDAPMASMFGLARRSIPTPQVPNTNVVRLKARGGRKRRRK
jgi:ornithine decarboxylase